MEQILGLKALYGNDLINYNAVFLGEHDALNADAGLIEFAAKAAYREFNLKNAYMNDANLFMFGSVNAFLGKTSAFFDRLDRLPYKTYINIGLESADQKTLDYLGKPLRRQDVISAFKKMLEINRCYPSIEITANFIMDSDTPQGHYPSMVNLTREIVGKVTPKGAIYLSPLNINSPSRKTVFEFYRLKTLSRLPMFLYTIQRL